ncbi:MAG: hypothetical protein ACN6NJ_01270 [Acinetobacter sp.]|jgi:hypothetical protein
MDITQLTAAVKVAIIFSGFFLWVGMLTGVWKYAQIRNSELARAHYYVDIAHRSSLLYAPATLILAVLAYFSIFSDLLNLMFVLINVAFFSFSILSYIVHGMLKDTSNQFKKPHQMGAWQIPTWMLSSAMLLLIVGELGSTLGLLVGTILKFMS